jgi:amidase
MPAEVHLLADPDLPGLLETLGRYETALAAHDLTVLDAAFAEGPCGPPVRATAGGAAVGSAQVAALRAGGSAPPRRRPERLHVRRVGTAWTVTLEGVRDDGTTSAQTQVWVDDRIVAAHVSGGPAPTPPASYDGLNAWRVRPSGGVVAAGEDGPLAGIRVAVKDLYDVAGHPRGAGNPSLLAAAPTPRRHAAAVQALVDAGAGIEGIARTDELAFGLSGVNAHEGAVGNPVRPGRLAGGSSGGSAAAVAAGEADLGLGTDTAGSIRVPASYTGLVGLRLTHGVVDLTGSQPLAPSFDAAGLLARDTVTLRRGAEALLGSEPSGHERSVRMDRIDRIVVSPQLLAMAGPTTREAVVAAVLALALRAGCTVATTDLVGADDLEAWFAAFRAVQAAEAYAEHATLLAAAPAAVSPEVRARLCAGDLPAAELARHRAVLADAAGRVRAGLDDGCVLALPSASGPAPLTGASLDDVRARTLRLGCVASLAGLPALSLPTPLAGGDPVGLGLVGAPGADLDLIELVERSRW